MYNDVDQQSLMLAASGGPEIQVWKRALHDTLWTQVIDFNNNMQAYDESRNVTSLTFRQSRPRLVATFLGGNM